MAHTELRELINDLSREQARQFYKLETSTLTFTLQYRDKTGLDAIEEFTIEGITNAINIFKIYRKNGHNMRLHTIRIDNGDELLKKLTFKYTIDGMKGKMKN